MCCGHDNNKKMSAALALRPADGITFTPEPDNPHDPNAIRVNADATQLYIIGHVPRASCGDPW